MKLYKALITNRYVHGTKYIVYMHIDDDNKKNIMSPPTTTAGSLKISYQLKAQLIICDVDLYDGIVRPKSSVENRYKRLVRVELIKGNLTKMQLSLGDEVDAKQIFIDSSMKREDEDIVTVFGSFRFLNSVLLFNIPAVMLQVL